MAKDFGAGNSEFHPILRLPEKAPLPRGEQWSRQPGCYQLKAALGWHGLYQETGDADFLKWYEDLLAASLRTHQSFLPGAAGDLVMDRLHAYCYFLEAVLRARTSPKSLAFWMRALAKWPHTFAISGLGSHARTCTRSCSAATVGRLRGVAPVDRPAATSEAEKLASFQLDHSDRRIAAGSSFAREGISCSRM